MRRPSYRGSWTGACWPLALALVLVFVGTDGVDSRGAQNVHEEPPQPAPELPLVVANEEWSPLYEHVDPELQRSLETMLAERKEWRSLVARRKLAVGLVDLSDPAHPRFARVNGNTMMYAASLAKIAILLAAYQAVEDRALALTPEVETDLNDMIRVSSNPAATRMIDRIGLDRIESTVTDPRYQLFDPKRGGGLWVGKRYGMTVDRRGDPLMNLSHAATVTQICRFYYLLATGHAVSPDRSRQMLDVLADPGLHHKFVHAFDERAPWARLFRKSGTWRDHHADSAIVWGDRWRRYILAALVESKDGGELLYELAPAVESILRPSKEP